MKTLFRPTFERDLRKAKDKALLERVEEAIKAVEAADEIAEIASLKKLHGYKHLYRIRVGDYRIGVYCETDRVEFVRFLHRKDIYQKFP